ncbi:MAG: type II toxin-antitoxin system PemK/MazF family toxin [Candidatus Peregrinibacteria bacterium]|nr:type II toxin-antitoxin system PemK/MazF family toxin [Candidatus Peregrinibacteria bacterium]
MEIKQGGIYWVDLDPVKGHEQAGKRPVLVLQNNELNENLNTVTVVPLTTNMAFKGFLTTYHLSAKQSGLKKDSLALLYQVRSIDKSRLLKKGGQLSTQDFSQMRIRLIRTFY